jgi:two-component system sensor histidine kinase UhpB
VLYRVAQESLTNAVRHSEATRLELRLERVPRGLVLRVTDNGRGLPAGELGSSVGGLRGMHEWALLVGGQLDVSSREGGGVQVRLRVRANDEAEGRAA